MMDIGNQPRLLTFLPKGSVLWNSVRQQKVPKPFALHLTTSFPWVNEDGGGGGWQEEDEGLEEGGAGRGKREGAGSLFKTIVLRQTRWSTCALAIHQDVFILCSLCPQLSPALCLLNVQDTRSPPAQTLSSSAGCGEGHAAPQRSDIY